MTDMWKTICYFILLCHTPGSLQNISPTHSRQWRPEDHKLEIQTEVQTADISAVKTTITSNLHLHNGKMKSNLHCTVTDINQILALKRSFWGSAQGACMFPGSLCETEAVVKLRHTQSRRHTAPNNDLNVTTDDTSGVRKQRGAGAKVHLFLSPAGGEQT